MARKKRLDPKLPIADGTNDSDAKTERFFRELSAEDVWAWLQQPDVFGDRLLRRLNELFLEFDGGTLSVYDEGTYLGEADGLNFTGAGVTAASSTTLPTGIFDVTIPGGGGGGDTISAEASEGIAAGQFVAVFDDSGTPKCRVANASLGQGYQADGFCEDAFASGATATIFLPGSVNAAGGTGLTAGDVWLGNDGYATSTPPTTAGYILQQIGVAESATSVAFEPQPDILIAATHSVGSAGIELLDEGVSLGNVTSINAVGAAITASISGDDGTLTVTGGGSQTLYVYFP
jgi:hypothetical protein